LEGTFFTRFEGITVDPAVATGKACIRDLRFPVSRLPGLLAAGETRESILNSYPYLEPADIDEALRYAAYLPEDEAIELTKPVRFVIDMPLSPTSGPHVNCAG
jgi:uncharacterized protein (DUF433 family)